MNKNNLAFMPSEPSPPVPERSMQDAFVQDGFALLRGALGSAVRAQAKAHMSEYLSTLLGRKVDYCDGFLAAMAKCPQYLVQEGIGEKLAQAGIYQEILRSPDLNRALLELLGPDLSFSPDQIVAAVAGVEDGYYKKDCIRKFGRAPESMRSLFGRRSRLSPEWGALILSRAHTIGASFPIEKENPVNYRTNANILPPQVEEGDVVVFHALTLHRSADHTHERPRFALPFAVRNYLHTPTNHEHLRIWIPYRHSPVSRVQKQLGNRYLTPFRTLGNSRDVWQQEKLSDYFDGAA